MIHVLALGRSISVPGRPWSLRSWRLGFRRLRICVGYHRLLTHNSFQTYKPVRWFFALLGSLTGRRSGSDLGRESPSPSSIQRQRRRSAFAARRRSLVTHVVVHAEPRLQVETRHLPEIRCLISTKIRSSVFWKRRLSVALRCWARLFFGVLRDHWRLVSSQRVPLLGVFVRMVYYAARHLCCELSHAHLGLPKLQDQRRQHQSLVGRVACVRRRLAQQPPRVPTHGPSRSQVVGNRRQLLAILFLEKTGLAWNVVKEPPKHGKPA